MKQRYSPKREAVLDAIRSTDKHPSAEWVYSELKRDFPALSLATVYRNIAEFKRKGLLVSVGVVDSQERFDADISCHAHFICDSCGAVIDVGVPEYSVPDLTKGTDIAEVKRCEVALHGLCKKCV